MNQRPRAILLRLSPEELAAVDTLAESQGLTRSDTIRQLIRRAAPRSTPKVSRKSRVKRPPIASS